MYDDSKKPDIPLESVASPIELPIIPGEELRWYKPGVAETVRAMGWRWIYFLPALLVLALLIAIPFHLILLQFLVPWIKIIIFAVAIPVGVALKGAKELVKQRKEPFCIHCGYVLTGLPDHHNCPECGRKYNFRLIEEYRRDPQWFIERYRRQKLLPKREMPFEAGSVRRKRSRDGT